MQIDRSPSIGDAIPRTCFAPSFGAPHAGHMLMGTFMCDRDWWGLLVIVVVLMLAVAWLIVTVAPLGP